MDQIAQATTNVAHLSPEAWASVIIALCALLTLIGTVALWTIGSVIKPLKVSVDNLAAVVKEVTTKMDGHRDEIADLDKRLAVVESELTRNE